MEQKQPTKGFMLVASFSKPYYDAAVMCADSIKDFYHSYLLAFCNAILARNCAMSSVLSIRRF